MKKFIAVLLAMLMVIPMGLVFSSATATNIAAGKTYSFTGLYTDGSGNVPYPDTDNKELTDGTIGLKENIGYASAQWLALHITGAGANTTDKLNEIVVNLGSSTSDITNFKLYAEECDGGISAPEKVEILISSDNTNFTSLGEATKEMFISLDDTANPTFGIYKYSFAASSAQTAKYVKFIVKHTTNWAFISEVEVYTGGDTTSEEPAEVAETITVDGTLDDNGWAADGWTHVDSSNGKWQVALEEGVTRTDNYDFQFRSDDTNLYFAFKFNGAPLGTATNDCFGNGKGSNLRLWTFVDGATYEGVAYTTYNSFLNIAYKDGETVVNAKQNTTPTANTGVDLAIDGITVKTSEGDNFWYVEASVPFTWFNATTDANFFISYSTPLEIVDNAPVSNNALSYGAYADGTETDKFANAPYKNWDVNADIEISFADVKLGFVENEEEDDFVDITGELVANPSYLLEVTAPANYVPGDTIDVTITLKNVVPAGGISLINFLLYYDAAKVEPVVLNDAATENDAMNDFLVTAPTKDAWEGLNKLEEAESRYDISFLTTNSTVNAKDDGSMVIVIPFKVKATATGSIAFQAPHADTNAYGAGTDYTDYFGNAGLAVAELATANESSDDTSEPTTGDAGIIAIAVVAVLALAGVMTVAVKKRSR